METIDNTTGEVLNTPYIDEHGRVVLSSEPMAIPVGFKRPETLAEQVARLVRSNTLMAHALVDEDIEDANDLDIPDDPADPTTPWENDHDLALINAIEKGVVKAPSVDELDKARDIISRAKNALSKRVKRASGDGEGGPPKATNEPAPEPTR